MPEILQSDNGGKVYIKHVFSVLCISVNSFLLTSTFLCTLWCPNVSHSLHLVFRLLHFIDKQGVSLGSCCQW
jgi:hypothetical protein